MDKLIPRSSCCFGLIDHRVGVLLIAAAYVFFSLIDAIVFPIIFNALALIGIIPGIILGAMMLWGVYFYKNRYIFIVPWLVFYGLGIFAGFILGIGAITKGAPAYSWVTLFLTIPVNVYFWVVVWYYFQRLGDPLDPIAEMNSGPEDTTVTSSGGGVGDKPVVLAVADLEVIQNGKERIEEKDEEVPNPFPDNPFA